MLRFKHLYSSISIALLWCISTCLVSSCQNVPHMYEVSFINYDGDRLYVDEVMQGETAHYYGDTPKRPSSETTDYTFYGWDKQLDNVQSSYNVYAVYGEYTPEYTVRFIGINDTVLSTEIVLRGQSAKYPLTATFPEYTTNSKRYTFSGWDSDYTHIKSDCNIHATYTSITSQFFYHVTDKDDCLIEYVSTDIVSERLNEVTIPDLFFLDGGSFYSINGIDDNAFSNCTKLQYINLKSNFHIIGSKAFYNCSTLREIKLPRQNITFGTTVFDNCSALTALSIPKEVTTLPANVIGNASNLVIYCEAQSKPSGWDDNWNSTGCTVRWNAKLSY